MDEISIKELQKGNETAFKQLVETYKHQVVNTCFGFTHNYADAEDIAQDVFVEIYESIQSFNQDAQLSTWIYRISINKSLDALRKLKRKKRWAELTRVNLDDKDESDHWFQNTENPQITLEQKERIQILNNAIDTLPKNQKSAFTLNKYEDLSYKEIAVVLDISLSSVESLMHRAKKNLQKRLVKYYLSEKL